VRELIEFTLIWVSQNLAIPFWVVGHVHLSLNMYDEIHELLASFGMNLVVLVGFIIDFKNSKKQKNV
tara:strand:+ start:549 stop:749 length:201 start_codon:yes stop_codon:yes gene_type:complete